MMETMRKFRVGWLILVMAIVGLKGDEMKNGTAPCQGNDTLLTPSNQGKNEEVKGKRDSSFTEVVFNTSKGSWHHRGGAGGEGSGGDEGGFRWGWGSGGGGGGGGGWGWGGGGGGWWKWGCGDKARHGKEEGGRGKGIKQHHLNRKGMFDKEGYRLGEFAQCMARTRCRGMRLACPLHCGGPCFYDCQHMCKAHCRRL